MLYILSKDAWREHWVQFYLTVLVNINISTNLANYSEMADIFHESADFSDLSDIAHPDVIALPSCPICKYKYSKRIIPFTMQPCGHTCCEMCLDILIENIELSEVSEDPLCPLCRAKIEDTTPNYTLQEITSVVDEDISVGFWEKQITKLPIMKGRKCTFSRSMRKYAKLIYLRIEYDDVIVCMKLDERHWTMEEITVVRSIKNAFIHIIHRTDDPMDIVCKWVGILSFPSVVENYLLKFFLEWYENRDFLKTMDGLWLMDVITYPV